jgi:hypothetical protein
MKNDSSLGLNPVKTTHRIALSGGNESRLFLHICSNSPKKILPPTQPFAANGFESRKIKSLSRFSKGIPAIGIRRVKTLK